MKRFLATMVFVLSANIAQAQTYGLWARSAEMCNQRSKTPGDWIEVHETGIRGHDFKCTFMNKQGNAKSFTVYSICGMNNSDVIFRDIFSIEENNNILIIKYDRTQRTFLKCRS